MEIKTVKRHTPTCFIIEWIESLKSAKKMQHALRVAVSNKAGSGKVSGSYVHQHQK